MQAVTRALNSGHGSAETLAARLRIRCARQRWRADRGKHSSIARMIPDAPSLTTSSGSPSPLMRRSWKNVPSCTVSTSSLRARHQPQQRFASVLASIPQAARTASRRWPGRQPLGDAVDEQIDDGVLGEIALAEVLVLGPKASR